MSSLASRDGARCSSACTRPASATPTCTLPRAPTPQAGRHPQRDPAQHLGTAPPAGTRRVLGGPRAPPCQRVNPPRRSASTLVGIPDPADWLSLSTLASPGAPSILTLAAASSASV